MKMLRLKINMMSFSIKSNKLKCVDCGIILKMTIGMNADFLWI